MFYLYSDEENAYLDISDGKEGSIDKDNLGSPNEVLPLNMDCQYFTSCAFQDYIKNHDAS